MKYAHSSLSAAAAGISLCFAGLTSAQTTIGPDGADMYMATVDTLESFPWIDISATGTAIYDDAGANTPVLDAVDVGFDFEFYGNSYSSLFIRPDGLLSFESPIPLPDDGSVRDVEGETFDDNLGSFDHPAIAVLWDAGLTTSGTADQVYYQTIGAEGERQFIVQWNQVEHFFANALYGVNASSISFQVVLFETSNIIEMRYLDTEAHSDVATDPGFDLNNGNKASVGIRGAGAPGNGEALQWSSRINEANVTGGMTIEFVPADDSAPTLTPLEQLLVNALEALIDSLEAKSGVTMPAWLANALITIAQALIDLIIYG